MLFLAGSCGEGPAAFYISYDLYLSQRKPALLSSKKE